ncbi:hypothetical protein BCEN4_860055 [Burkholderia cenocepacia]|nr:hypothetical protein BCEN4_860055 [Burkholderia cenocepacia]
MRPRWRPSFPITRSTSRSSLSAPTCDRHSRVTPRAKPVPTARVPRGRGQTRLECVRCTGRSRTCRDGRCAAVPTALSRGPHVFQERRRVALSHRYSIVARPVGRVRERVDHAARRAGAGRADADSRRNDGGDGAGVLGQHVRGRDRRDDAGRFAVVLHGPHARPAPAERPRAFLAVARHDAALRA